MGVRGRVYQKHSSKNITARPQFYQFISVYIGMIDNQYHSYPSRVVISFSMEASGSSFMSNISFLQHFCHVELEVEIHASRVHHGRRILAAVRGISEWNIG